MIKYIHTYLVIETFYYHGTKIEEGRYIISWSNHKHTSIWLMATPTLPAKKLTFHPVYLAKLQEAGVTKLIPLQETFFHQDHFHKEFLAALNILYMFGKYKQPSPPPFLKYVWLGLGIAIILILLYKTL